MTTTSVPDHLVLELEDIGPHAGRTPIVFRPGRIQVLRGANGAGKSKLQEAVEYYLTGRGDKPEARWGSGGGRIAGLGKTVHVGLSRCTTRDELVVDTFDGGVDIGVWIDPGVDDAEKADMRRIKLLCLVANVQADIDAFADLFGGVEAMNRMAPPGTIGAGDVVEMAAKVRKRLQQLALDEKQAAEAAEGTASGLRQAVGGADLQAESAEDVLHTRLEQATSARARLVEQALAAERSTLLALSARRTLERAEIGYAGPTVEAAQAGADQAAARRDETLTALNDAQAALARATQDHEAARSADQLARQQLQAAQQHDNDLASAREALTSATSGSPAPTAAAMADAEDVVAKARAAVELGTRVRLAREQIRQADAAAATAAQCRREALRLTDAAKGTDEVLARLLTKVMPAGIKIGNGARLLTQQGDRDVFVHDLSPGQLGAQAVRLLMQTAPAGAVGTINQIVWEGLDGNARLGIAQQAYECQIGLLTAEADRTPGEVGPLRVEDYPYGHPAATPSPVAAKEGGAG